MTITNAEFISSNKRQRVSGGLYINFISSENISMGNKVEISFDNSIHYFEVTDVKISNQFLNLDLDVTAKEVGYWVRKFDRIENFDLRTIIRTNVRLVKDENKIQEINKMSCWC